MTQPAKEEKQTEAERHLDNLRFGCVWEEYVGSKGTHEQINTAATERRMEAAACFLERTLEHHAAMREALETADKLLQQGLPQTAHEFIRQTLSKLKDPHQ